MARNGRLFDALDAQPIVWLHGPPGAGKTTLIAGWLLERKFEPIWQRLDAEDPDPSTLFFYLGIAETRAHGAGVARRLPLLTPEYQFGTAAFSRNFFQNLFDGPAPATLVLDDYHELDMSSPIHDLIANGLKEIPEGGHVIVISRFPPPKEFARCKPRRGAALPRPHALLRDPGAQGRGSRRVPTPTGRTGRLGPGAVAFDDRSFSRSERVIF